MIKKCQFNDNINNNNYTIQNKHSPGLKIHI